MIFYKEDSRLAVFFVAELRVVRHTRNSCSEYRKKRVKKDVKKSKIFAKSVDIERKNVVE